MNNKIFILLIGFILFLIPSASGLIWSNNAFNNSLSEEQLLFDGTNVNTRYLSIPNTVNYLTLGFIEIIHFKSESVYDDFLDSGNVANVSKWVLTAGGGGLSINNQTGGMFYYSSNFGGAGDSDGNNLTTNFSALDLNVDGTKVFIRNNDTIWSGGDSSGTLKYRLVDDSDNVADLYLHSQVGTVNNQVMNISINTVAETATVNYTWDGGSFNGVTNLSNLSSGGIWGFSQLMSPSNANMQNRMDFLKTSTGVISNLTIGTQDSGFVISTNGTTPITTTVGNLASIITNHLNSSFLVGSNYLIPFIFRSDVPGKLNYTNLNFSNFGLTENSQTFQDSAFDTARESFILNITFDSNRYSSSAATLIYNGTRISSSVSTSGRDFIFSAEKDIGIVTSQIDNAFYWEIALTDVGGQVLFNSTFKNQSVSPSTLIQCGSGENAINYTTYDEEDQTLLVTDFDATFSWTLNEGSSIVKNISVSLSGANNYQFCINSNETFFINVDINLDADGFTQRNFGFNKQPFSNETTHQKLYLLNDTLGTDFILTLKDVGLFPLSDHVIQIFRKLESGGEILVENDVTDHIGQIVSRVIQNDAKYRILFFDEDNVLVKSIPNAIFTCVLTVCRKTFIVQDLTGAFNDFDDLEDHTSSLTFDNDTRTFSFSWVDNRGESSTHRMLVEKITFSNGTEVVFNGTSTSDSGVLSYVADTSRASYRVSAFRLVGTDEDRLFVLNVGIGDSADVFSLEGLYWSFILFMLMLLVGRFHPPSGVILYLFSVFMLGIFGIIFISPAILIAELVLGILFIWAWRG